jgi:predicted nucleic acid-binding protein
VRVVVDASAVAEFISDPSKDSRLSDLLRDSAELHVPTLCDVEFASVVVRSIRRHDISPERAVHAIEDYLALPIQRHGHLTLLRRALELRHNFTPYDAMYVALSEHLSAPLLTADNRLARAARAHKKLEVISE